MFKHVISRIRLKSLFNYILYTVNNYSYVEQYFVFLDLYYIVLTLVEGLVSRCQSCFSTLPHSRMLLHCLGNIGNITNYKFSGRDISSSATKGVKHKVCIVCLLSSLVYFKYTLYFHLLSTGSQYQKLLTSLGLSVQQFTSDLHNQLPVTGLPTKIRCVTLY